MRQPGPVKGFDRVGTMVRRASMTDLAIWTVMGCYPGFTPHRIAATNAKTRRAWLRAGFGRNNHFDKNTTTHWTSQARFDSLIHSCAQLRLGETVHKNEARRPG
jgi:hypothetical protein